MNQSIIERIFPHPPGSRSRVQSLAYGGSTPRADTPPPAIVLGDYEEGKSTIKAPPLSASTLHYEDAFLPVERAAKALQRNIQTYLDAQSERLATHARHNDDYGVDDDVSSAASPSPSTSLNRSTAMSWRQPAGIKTVPIRQPPQKKISLRGSRRGLARAMDELVQLKEQELRIIERESQGRERALQQTEAFKSKRISLQAGIEALRGEDNQAAASSLREAAHRVEAEIGELEKRLIELRTRHAHLIDHAQQLENAHDSKLSSYTSSLALLEKETAQFLRAPPVRSSLSAEPAGMYALRPDRRTLDMAQEQWEHEQSQLAQRKADAESELGALEQGAGLWRDSVQKISDYEQELGKLVKTNGGSNNTASENWSRLLTQLDTLVADVSSALAVAESRGWNLLICCLGAELEALQEARVLLGGGSSTDGLGEDSQPSKESTLVTTEAVDLLNGIDASLGGVKVNGSNESLEDTLHHAHGWQKEHVEADTDNDEPSPDFLVSHS
ncbi:hypothetical protein DV738_g3526, partial [Chaetothyriales sp. CBS 135597]